MFEFTEAQARAAHSRYVAGHCEPAERVGERVYQRLAGRKKYARKTGRQRT